MTKESLMNQPVTCVSTAYLSKFTVVVGALKYNGVVNAKSLNEKREMDWRIKSCSREKFLLPEASLRDATAKETKSGTLGQLNLLQNNFRIVWTWIQSSAWRDVWRRDNYRNITTESFERTTKLTKSDKWSTKQKNKKTQVIFFFQVILTLLLSSAWTGRCCGHFYFFSLGITKCPPNVGKDKLLRIPEVAQSLFESEEMAFVVLLIWHSSSFMRRLIGWLIHPVSRKKTTNCSYRVLRDLPGIPHCDILSSVRFDCAVSPLSGLPRREGNIYRFNIEPIFIGAHGRRDWLVSWV